MKHRSIRILISAIIALESMSLTGCGGEKLGNSESKENTKPAAVVIIAGRHANAKMYSEKMIDDASDIIEQSYVINRTSDKYTGTAQISVIVSDGDPEVVPVELNGEDILSYTSNNAENIREFKKELVSNLKQFLFSPSLKADDSDVDLLLALTRAQGILNGYPDCEHHILVLDTGITTSGYLDMSRVDVLSNEIADTIQTITPGIPDFNETQITFYGLGNVAGTQPSIMSNDGRKKLVELWKNIIVKGNGSLTNELNFNDAENTDVMYFSEDGGENIYPIVSTVFFADQLPGEKKPGKMTIIKKDNVSSVQEPPAPTWVFQTSDLGGFKPDSAEFLRKDVAISTLNNVANEIEEHLNSEDAPILYVVGSIAKTSPDSNQRESDVAKGRAEAVAKLLIDDYNVPNERIKIINAGTTEFSWRNAKEFPDGINKDPIAAQNNRVVAIISSSAEEWVAELRENHYIN